MKKLILRILIIISIIAVLIGGLIYYLFYDLNSVPRQILYKTYESQDKNIELNIYLNPSSLSKNTYLGCSKFKGGKERAFYFDFKVKNMIFHLNG